jgi:hypothetical protein
MRPVLAQMLHWRVRAKTGRHRLARGQKELASTLSPSACTPDPDNVLPRCYLIRRGDAPREEMARAGAFALSRIYELLTEFVGLFADNPGRIGQASQCTGCNRPPRRVAPNSRWSYG